MQSVQDAGRSVTVRARNVGGIVETEVAFEPGVNVLAGRNASNRTSLLQAVMAALGSERVSLKADADDGQAELTIGDDTYTRSLKRVDADVTFGGSPYTDDPALADLFAFLLESNEARRAVERGDDLRELIMRPVDTAAIREEIDTLLARQRELEGQREERDRVASERDRLEGRSEELEAELAEHSELLDEKQAAIDDASAELEESRERKAELEAKLVDLRDRQSTQEDVRQRLKTEGATVEELREELREVEAELADRREQTAEPVEDLESRRETLRERKRHLDSRVSQLQSLVQFNEEMLSGDEGGAPPLEGADADGDVTDELLPGGESVRCWTCGETTTREHVEETLGELREQRSDLVDRRREVRTELEAVSDRIETVNERVRRHADLERRSESLEAELREAVEATASLETELDEVADDIATLEDEVEQLREEAYDELIDLHAEANALEIGVEQCESELAEIERSLASKRERLEELSTLGEERATVAERLERARTRVERLEVAAVETFNEQMAAVLEVLDYENVERIWIERTEREVREGRRTVRRGSFDLHVVRQNDQGAVYEDTVAHLSESEREVTGLVFALAGYLAHDLHEVVPFVLLDSIEAIDADRIASLVDYLADVAPYLVVALLPEDAAGIDDAYHVIPAI